MTRVAVYSVAPIGGEMASPAIRAYQLARILGQEFDVTLIAPGAESSDLHGVEPPTSQRELGELLEAHEAVLAQKLPPRLMRRLAAGSRQVVYDLYTPSWLESLAVLRASSDRELPELIARAEALIQKLALATGNAFVCTHERQRDFWVGGLGALGRIGPEGYATDPTFRGLIDVVPFGLPEEPPVRRAAALRGVVPGIGADDVVLLWAGGVLSWTDADTVLRGHARVAARRSDVKLVFLGFDGNASPAAREAFETARSLGLLDRSVFFIERWVPYADRADFLLDADVGVAAYVDAVEARLAFRARLLDYFWAGLPTITTAGDALGDLVASRGLGRAIAPGDVDGWAKAIESLADEHERRRCAANLEPVRRELAWPEIVAPLVRMLTVPGRPVRNARAATIELELAVLRARISYRVRGPAGAIRRAARLPTLFRASRPRHRR